MTCPILELKTSCGIVGLPEGCPLRQAQCPIMKCHAVKPPPDFGSFTDTRDGRVYKTVKIGRQVWLAENLAFDYAGSKVYGNDLANLPKYGRLYDWETAKKAVPPGWRLPTEAEWATLADFAGGRETAGRKLKAESGWSEDGSGTDEFGFAALPGGYGRSSGDFNFAGDNGYWWSATEGSSDYAYSRAMYYYNEVML